MEVKKLRFDARYMYNMISDTISTKKDESGSEQARAEMCLRHLLPCGPSRPRRLARRPF